MDGREIIWIVVLALLSLEDLRKRKIAVWFPATVFLWEVLDLLQQEDIILGYHLWGAALGLAFCILSILTKEVIGLGDGLVIGLLGFHIGIRNLFICLCIAFFIAGLMAIVLCGINKFGKRARLPFVPCLYMGYLLKMWICLEKS